MADDYAAEHTRRKQHASGMGGERKLAALAAKGGRNARERVDRLFADGSFRAPGLFATA